MMKLNYEILLTSKSSNLLNNYIDNNCVSSSYMINNFNLKTLPYLGVKLLWNLRDLIILF